MLQMLLAMGGPALIRRGPREAPGVVLQKTKVRILDRHGSEYKRNVLEYQRTRAEFLRDLAAHPVGRSLALIALGKEGVEALEQGRLPKWPTGAWVTVSSPPMVKIGSKKTWERLPIRGPIFPKDRPLGPLPHNLKTARGKPVSYPPHAAKDQKSQSSEGYQCHHIVQKSTLSVNDPSGVNDPCNLVVVQTLRSGNNQRNWHHYWHAGFLHPQTHLAAGSLATVYFVRPLFPVYPPIRQAFHTVEEVQEALQKLDPNAKLPRAWAQRLVAFSEAVGHREPLVPEKCREAIRAFQEIHLSPDHDPEDEERRRQRAAELGAPWACQWLPPGAQVLGKCVPKDQEHKTPLAVISEPTRGPLEPLSGSEHTRSGRHRRSPRHPGSAGKQKKPGTRKELNR